MGKIKMKHIDISVIILNFNTRGLTDTCIERLKQSVLGEYHMEIILCDNASIDGTVEQIRKKYPDVIVIQNKGNLGFAAGNNPGIRRAKGRYVVLLNSDTEVSTTAIAQMIAFMDLHPRAGAATCKLVLPDGRMDPACHRDFRRHGHHSHIWSSLRNYFQIQNYSVIIIRDIRICLLFMKLTV